MDSSLGQDFNTHSFQQFQSRKLKKQTRRFGSSNGYIYIYVCIYSVSPRSSKLGAGVLRKHTWVACKADHLLVLNKPQQISKNPHPINRGF